MTDFNYEHISAEVLTDSIFKGNRITTLKIRIPKFLNAEFNTHRAFCRNFSSSRAIPAKKLRAEVLNNPFIPVYWGANQAGMSAKNELYGFRKWISVKLWRGLSKIAVLTHWLLEKAGLHKQTCNRIIEPWLSVSGVVTATEWENFFKLRCHFAAQPEMQMLAWKIRNAINASTPKEMTERDIHLPFIDDEEKAKYDKADLVKISIARVCRTSYNNNYGAKSNPEEDIKLYSRLLENGHMSPFEAIAVPVVDGIDSIYHNRNYRGWASIRSFVEPEDRKELLEKHYGISL